MDITQQLKDLFSSFNEIYGHMEGGPKAGHTNRQQQRDIQGREIRSNRVWSGRIHNRD